MSYSIKYLESVVTEDIAKLPKREKLLIKRAIEERLGENPVAYGKPLRYSLRGCRRIRVGDYRVVYQIEAQSVVVVKIGHRKDVYDE
jgi:mRNA interferase RelE/StbE